MKKKYFAFLLFLFIFSFLVSVFLYSFPTGITGVTRKTGGSGCSCHGPSASAVTVSINGPDSVSPGQVVTYTVVITGGPLVRGGADIAAQNGVLNIISGQGLQKIGDELTQTAPKAPSGNNVSFQFSYTAPNQIGKDTIYATGNSVNFNNNNNGDQWNHANNRVIVIRNPIGIINQSIPEGFNLYQNYPNPFNPVTKIMYEIPSLSGGFNAGDKASVMLKIFDIMGNEIKTYSNLPHSQGTHEIEFDGSDFSSGVYYYRLSAGEYTASRKMLMVK